MLEESLDDSKASSQALVLRSRHFPIVPPWSPGSEKTADPNHSTVPFLSCTHHLGLSFVHASQNFSVVLEPLHTIFPEEAGCHFQV